MTEISTLKIRVKFDSFSVIFRCFVLVLFCGLLMLAGCVSVATSQQRLVSKPNMQFSESVIFNYQDRSLTQIESGSASFIGGQSGSCGSCVGEGSQ